MFLIKFYYNWDMIKKLILKMDKQKFVKVLIYFNNI